MRAQRPIDSGDPAKYQWRPLLNDQASAAALANRFTIKELKSLEKEFPEYYKALDEHSHGEAQKRMDEDFAREVTYV